MFPKKVIQTLVLGGTVILGGIALHRQNLLGPVLSTKLKYYQSPFRSADPFRKDLPLPIINHPVSSDDNSIAKYLEKAKGDILPVDAEAFALGTILHTPITGVTEHATPNQPRKFYESLGIKIGEPFSDLPGWYHCELPAGWRIDSPDVPDESFQETTVFLDDSNRPMFGIDSTKVCGRPGSIILIIDSYTLNGAVDWHARLRLADFRKTYTNDVEFHPTHFTKN